MSKPSARTTFCMSAALLGLLLVQAPAAWSADATQPAEQAAPTAQPNADGKAAMGKHGAMQGMGHGSMKGMDHDAMKGMDHDAMQGMDHRKMMESQGTDKAQAGKNGQ
ncbi:MULTISPECIES: hypothetical protein [Pseudomonas putida group]|uniref:hypothetical protein n=1 Tax=Pseudomonas putida group TaxID=136845 RepID=UPI001E64D6E2|nr:MULTISPECIES: hypothetical protein [Pseudomonas putida group]